MNKQIVKGKWKELKGEVQKAWGKLTNDELEKTQGDLTAIAGLIQQKYGRTQDDLQSRLEELFDRVVEEKDDAVKSVKDDLRDLH